MMLFYFFKNGTDNINIGQSFKQGIIALAVFGGLYTLIIPIFNYSPKERYIERLNKQNINIPQSIEKDYSKPIKKIKLT